MIDAGHAIITDVMTSSFPLFLLVIKMKTHSDLFTSESSFVVLYIVENLKSFKRPYLVLGRLSCG